MSIAAAAAKVDDTNSVVISYPTRDPGPHRVMAMDGFWCPKLQVTAVPAEPAVPRSQRGKFYSNHSSSLRIILNVKRRPRKGNIKVKTYHRV